MIHISNSLCYCLSEECFANIVYRLVPSTITTSSEFNPFVIRFKVINTAKYDKFQYQALLETTSYFWASTGGRGTLLEKIVASVGKIHIHLVE